MIAFFEDVRKLLSSFEQNMEKWYLQFPRYLRVILFIITSPLIIAYLVITRVLRILDRLAVFMIKPLKVISHHVPSFFLWIAFTLFGGLMGVIVNICRNMWFVTDANMNFPDALKLELSNGSFYTYAIAIIAAVLCSILTQFAETNKEDLNFRGYQIVIVSFSVFTILFGGVFYSLSKAFVDTARNTNNNSLDWAQLIVFFVAIIISVYSFCVVHLNEHKEEFKDIIDQPKQKDTINGDDLNSVKADNKRS